MVKNRHLATSGEAAIAATWSQ